VTTPESELVDAARDGDYAAFEALVRSWSDRVHRLAWSFTRNEADAEEVTQDAFLNAFRALPDFRGHAFGAWMRRITVNTALMRLRRRRRRPEVSLESTKGDDVEGHHHDSPLLIDDLTASRELRQQQVGERIAEAVDTLDEKYRTVFLLREIEGLSIAETGEVLGLTTAAVKSRMHRARLALRATLERFAAEHGVDTGDDAQDSTEG